MKVPDNETFWEIEQRRLYGKPVNVIKARDFTLTPLEPATRVDICPMDEGDE